MSKSALGRGLGALLGGVANVEKAGLLPAAAGAGAREVPSAASTAGEAVWSIALGRIQPSSLQPRKDFPAEALDELANSIREKGILQPLIVRRRGDDFELIAGERRWRAAQKLGLTEVPVIVREADDATVLELMLIENLQRENLNPIEEAAGYHQLITQFQLHQEEIALKVGKNRATVANALRLLKLEPLVQDWVRIGQLSVGHAKVILGLEQPEEQRLVAEQVIRQGLSVRATEDWVARWQQRRASGTDPKTTSRAAPLERDAQVNDLENRLQERFGTKVQLRYRQGKGAVTIHFFNDDDLTRLLELFSVKVD